jgi:DNA-binding NarL/FixJ family response regulator
MLQDTQPLRYRVRVVVADSSPITSQLIAEAVSKDVRLDVVGFSSDPSDIVDLIVAERPDVLLISARMQEEPQRGLELVKQLRGEGQDFKAVVLIDSNRAEAVVGAFRVGASGVFCRNAPLDLLPKCIVAVYQGQIWANSQELNHVVAALYQSSRIQMPKADTALRSLSKREREVAQWLAEGLTNREIADNLRISPNTVKNYVFNIFEKLGVSNRVELALYVLSRSIENQDTVSLSIPAENFRQKKQVASARA